MVRSRDAWSLLTSLAIASSLTMGSANAQDEASWLSPSAADEITSSEGVTEGGNCFDQFNRIFVCNCPKVYFIGDALWLKRNTSRDQTLGVFTQNVATPGVISTGTLDFDYEPGMRLTLGYALNCTATAEVTYWGLQDWDSVNIVNANAAAGTFVISGVPSIGMIPGTLQTFAANYSSNVHNVEMNLKANVHLFPHVKLVGGFRYLHINDELQVFQSGVVPNPFNLVSDYALRVETNNNLFGAHIGGDVIQPFGDRFEAGAMGRFGVFANVIDVTQQQALANDPFNIGARADQIQDQLEAAYLFESALWGTYRLNDNISIRGGYQVTWVKGVSLAPEQFVPGLFSGGQIREDSGGELFMHGPFVGIDVRWGACSY